MTRRARMIAFATLAASALAACEPTAGGGSAYYDTLLWNDYYYGYPRPPRPDPPDRPDRPRPEHPIARPPVARPPVHRPPVARPMPARPARF